MDEDVFLGDMVVCHAPRLGESNKKKRGRATAQLCLFKDTTTGVTYKPILGRCLTNGKKGGTVDVILSANAPGLLWF